MSKIIGNVDGVDVIENSIWRNKRGEEGTIFYRGDSTDFPLGLMLEDGGYYTYTESGEDYPGNYSDMDLKEPVIPETKKDSNQKVYSIKDIEEACDKLGWTYYTRSCLVYTLKSMNDPEYQEYLRLKEKFEGETK